MYQHMRWSCALAAREGWHVCPLYQAHILNFVSPSKATKACMCKLNAQVSYLKSGAKKRLNVKPQCLQRLQSCSSRGKCLQNMSHCTVHTHRQQQGQVLACHQNDVTAASNDSATACAPEHFPWRSASPQKQRQRLLQLELSASRQQPARANAVSRPP